MSAHKEQLTAAVMRALERALRPLVRILIRYGVSYRAFAALTKRMYVGVAAEEFPNERKRSVSRIAILTGLPRKDVARILEDEDGGAGGDETEHSRVASILSGWRYDANYLDARGRPSALPFDGSTGSFSGLVREYGSDVPARAVLDEFARIGAVRRLKDGRITLVAESFIPAEGEIDKLGILGADVADLVATIDHNLVAKPDARFFQRKVTYDNIPAEVLEKLRSKSAQDAAGLIERTDEFFAKHDRDVNPAAKGTGRKRIVLGVWFYAEDVAPDPKPESPGEEKDT